MTAAVDRSDASDADFQQMLARIEATPAAEESLRERVALAMFDTNGGHVWENATIGGQYQREQAYRLADAAIAVVTTAQGRGEL